MKKEIIKTKDLLKFFLQNKILKLNILFNIFFFLYISFILIGANILSYIYQWNIKLTASLWILGLILLLLFKAYKGIK